MAEADERIELIVERHSSGPELAAATRRKAEPPEETDSDGKRETPIRPERFARLVTLAGILIEAARDGEQAQGQRSSASASRSASRSCARTSTCSTS